MVMKSERKIFDEYCKKIINFPVKYNSHFAKYIKKTYKYNCYILKVRLRELVRFYIKPFLIFFKKK